MSRIQRKFVESCVLIMLLIVPAGFIIRHGAKAYALTWKV